MLVLRADEVVKTVIDLQPLRETTSARVVSKSGKDGVATLINLNPGINTWFVLKVNWKDEEQDLAFHLENLRPKDRKIMLEEKYPLGLVVLDGKSRYNCELFGGNVFTT